MQLFPSKTQWKNWTLPSKASFIGALLGVFGLLLTLIIALFTNNYNISITGDFKQNSLSNNGVNSSAILQDIQANNISVSVINTQTQNGTDKVSSPLFEVYVNEIAAPIHDRAIIKLSDNRSIRIPVQNVGQFAADNLGKSIYIPLESNTLTYAGWTSQAPPIKPETRQEIPDLLHLWSVAAGVIPENGWFRSPLLSLSKDLPSPKFTRRTLEEFGFEFHGSATKCPMDFVFHVLPVIVSVNSSRSTDHRVNLFLLY